MEDFSDRRGTSEPPEEARPLSLPLPGLAAAKRPPRQQRVPARARLPQAPSKGGGRPARPGAAPSTATANPRPLGVEALGARRGRSDSALQQSARRSADGLTPREPGAT
ncbi:unnamed protein product [Prorocentrum cordatum]|uniref:Uncharacterized protein n=1 Tax=Prorocentrum cordatum TaxID=2364126 RepID=A0ABN9X7E5_9DINO|nr:unnamed protein product [Polarella glacialis]